MRLPDFLIIGAAKAGTTSLYKVLARHPGIFLSQPKEPEFFARDDRYGEGIRPYAALFETAATDQLCGEASTLYSLSPLFPDTAGRIRAHVPGAKLVYVLREPVARAYSYYVQLVKNRQNASGEYRVARSFEECLFPQDHPGRAPREAFFAGFDTHLPDDPVLFTAGSDYLHQIRTYLRHFDRSQMHFISFESFMADPGPILSDLCGFLGLDPAPLGAEGMARANISEDHFDTVGTTLAVERVKARMGPLYAPAKLLPDGVKQRLKGLLRARQKGAGGPHLPPPMLPGTRAQLSARFAPDRAEIEALTGLDLGHWDRA